MPHTAVAPGGSPTVRSGSSTTARGRTSGWLKVSLRWSSVRVIRPPPLVSEAVPEVVGTATVGTQGSLTRAGGAKVAKSIRSASSRSGEKASDESSMPDGAAMAMYLPQSITEPPPTSTITVPSVPNPRSDSTPAATLASVGFGSTSSNAVHSMPSLVSVSMTVLSTPAARTPGSLTTKARLPWVRTCSASPATLPSPTRVVGMGSSV